MKSSPQRSRIRRRISAEKRIRFSNDAAPAVGRAGSTTASRTGRRPRGRRRTSRCRRSRSPGRDRLPPTNPSIELLDLVVGHRVAAVGVVVRGQARRRPVRGERVVGVAVLADVVQLVDHHDVGVRRPAGVGQPPEGRDDRVVVVAEVAPGQDPGAVDRHRLDDDHPGAAERPLPVVADVALAGQAALGHVGGVGAEGDPAPQRPVAQPERLEHVRERLAHGAGSPPSTPGCAPSAAGSAFDPAVAAAAARRRRNASIAMTPPIARRGQDHDVDEQPEGERRVARDPEALGDGHHGQLERADVAGPGRDDRDQRDAAREQRRLRDGELDADRLAGRQERAGRGGPGERAEGEGQRRSPAAGRRRRARRAGGAPARAARGRRAMIAATRSAPGSRWAAIPSPRRDDQQRRRRRARAGPRWSSRRGRSGRATASAAIATTITVSTTRSTTTVPRTVVRLMPSPSPSAWLRYELAEASRQDVVGEVADVRVAEDAPVGQRRDRREERAPASAARADVDERRDEHHRDPGRRCGAQDLERRLRCRPSG